MMTTRACAALALLLTAACRAPADDAASAHTDAAAARTDTAQPAPATLPPHVFVPERAHVGDTVAGLRIVSMEIARAYDGRAVGSVRFDGQTRVSGRVQAHPDPEAGLLCFFADSASAARLPRFPHDERRAWFCFANQDRARRLLPAPPDTSRAAIVIDSLGYHFRYSDVHNEARLVRVEEDGGGR